jgi:UDP-N-acetylmuramoyl-tripeptide--D-alanyl-D-alanine ligase
MSATLWTAEDARAATGGSLSGAAWGASGVSIDSRTLKPGDLFIALAGPNHDGHDHVASALAAGAAAAMVHRRPAGLSETAPLLTVADTTAGLQALGGAARARSQAAIVAVTGSVGKTGTKEMLVRALEAQGATHATTGNLNNHWGAPLSLARMPAATRFGIFELGMNHPGELTPLTRMVRPHVAVITAVEAVHTQFFTGTEQIAEAKAEILLGVESGGTAVLPRDNPHFLRLRAAAEAAGVARVQTFGSHIEADARLLDCGIDPESTAVFALVRDRAIAYRVGVAGVHWAMNSLSALLAAGALGADVDAAARALKDMTAPKGRGQRRKIAMEGGSIQVIDESYNASPVSMKAAIAILATARPAKGGRRIAVLGDMLELGEGAPALHAGLAETIDQWGIDLVFTAGPLMSTLFARLPAARRGGHAVDSQAAALLVKGAVRPGDVVMVKGSAGSRMGRVVNALCGE